MCHLLVAVNGNSLSSHKVYFVYCIFQLMGSLGSCYLKTNYNFVKSKMRPKRCQVSLIGEQTIPLLDQPLLNCCTWPKFCVPYLHKDFISLVACNLLMDDFYCLCLYDKDIFTDNYAFSTTIAGVEVLEMVLC